MNAASPKVFFGGPDRPPRLLRDLLEQKVDAVPAGGTIHWLTYYFRDLALADALVRAQRRGVTVRLALEGEPHIENANEPVIRRLAGPDGIGEGLRVVRHRLPGHLHTKLYGFSHPQPVALVGSFNPSGNEPEDPAILADIGDQDRGHNLLVELNRPNLVKAFVARAAAIHSGAGRFGLVSMSLKATVRTKGYTGYFFPQLGRNPLEKLLAALRRGSKLRIAASHIRDETLARRLSGLVRRGVDVRVLTHHTMRRAPDAMVSYLRDAGITVHRYEHPDELPMHSKFILAEDQDRAWSTFGSYNLKGRSRWLNQELLVHSNDRGLWNILDERWRDIVAEPWCRQ
jgi:phosphatidylserine/phosphatidylglycerophosphate/cardiolipin synthase-like enzyme